RPETLRSGGAAGESTAIARRPVFEATKARKHETERCFRGFVCSWQLTTGSCRLKLRARGLRRGKRVVFAFDLRGRRGALEHHHGVPERRRRARLEREVQRFAPVAEHLLAQR